LPGACVRESCGTAMPARLAVARAVTLAFAVSPPLTAKSERANGGV